LRQQIEQLDEQIACRHGMLTRCAPTAQAPSAYDASSCRCTVQIVPVPEHHLPTEPARSPPDADIISTRRWRIETTGAAITEAGGRLLPNIQPQRRRPRQHRLNSLVKAANSMASAPALTLCRSSTARHRAPGQERATRPSVSPSKPVAPLGASAVHDTWKRSLRCLSIEA
jgi:hypothetical protein